MLRSYFSHSRNLQINGDVVFMASQDNDGTFQIHSCAERTKESLTIFIDFIHVDPQVQPTNGHRRILEPGARQYRFNTIMLDLTASRILTMQVSKYFATTPLHRRVMDLGTLSRVLSVIQGHGLLCKITSSSGWTT